MKSRRSRNIAVGKGVCGFDVEIAVLKQLTIGVRRHGLGSPQTRTGADVCRLVFGLRLMAVRAGLSSQDAGTVHLRHISQSCSMVSTELVLLVRQDSTVWSHDAVQARIRAVNPLILAAVDPKVTSTRLVEGAEAPLKDPD